nr:MAG TPA: hypothetical protein [Caudoviricetes sp.]
MGVLGMRCHNCKYKQPVMCIEDDYCTTCWLTSEDEQTENKYGIGCIFNQKTLDKRHKEILKGIERGDYNP